MPKYIYLCDSCGEYKETWHTMATTLQLCTEITGSKCAGDLTRVPAIPNIIKSSTAGTLVKKAIVEARDEVNQQKRDLKKEVYE